MPISGHAVTGTYWIPIYKSAEEVPPETVDFCLESDPPAVRDRKAAEKAARELGREVKDLHVFSTVGEKGGWSISCGYQA